MATKIRGITIELGANTSKLEKALKNVNGEINGTQKQLKDVERLLKLDPHNTELLAQKQQLLNDKVTETREKLELVKDAQKKFIDEGGDLNSAEYMALTREVISCEDYLKKATKEANNFKASSTGVAETWGKISDKAGEVADKTAKMSKVATAGLGAVAGMVGASVNAFADYEQLTGGLEAIFGEESAKKVIENSNKAFSTAGLDANTYMETVTGFSASLIASLEGDTEKAVELSNLAIVDMSDNANRMGSDIGSIMNAYSGFAKGQFNMLDNLKLGYGGTKTEMERLLADAEALSGIHYDIDNYADVVSAIHIMQESLNIAGATAEESSTTITGSLNSLKASLQNLILGFSVEGANIEQLINDVITNVTNLKNNLIPVFQTIWDNTPAVAKLGVIITGIVAVISPIAGLISGIAGTIKTVITVVNLLNLALGEGGLMGLISGVGSKLAFLVSNPIGLLIVAIVGLVTLLATKGDEVRAILQNVDDFLQNIFALDFTEVFGTVLGGVLNNFFAYFGLVWNNIKTILDGVISFVQNVFAGNWSGAWESIKGIFTGVFSNIYNFATSKLQGIIDFINNIIGLAKQGIEKINELTNASNDAKGSRRGNNNNKTPWDAITNPSMPMFANGGSLVGHGSAIVGEAGAELLTLANGRATVTPLTVNMNNQFGEYNHATGGAVARDLVRQINYELGKIL